jgi:hypothetical protein
MSKRDTIVQFLSHVGAATFSIIICRIIYFACQLTSGGATEVNFYDFSQITSISYNVNFLLSRDEALERAAATTTRVSAQELIAQYPENIERTVVKIESSEVCEDASFQVIGDSSVIVCAEGSIVFAFSPSFDFDGFGNGFGKSVASVMILSQDYQWLFSSTTEVEGSLGLGLLPIERQIEEEAIQEWIQSSSAVVAVGTASYEGSLERENDRAAVRSTEVYALLLNFLARYQTAKSLFKLNLGQYDDDKCAVIGRETTGYQRPVIILGVFTSLEQPDFLSQRQVQKAVSQLEKNPLPNLDLWCYSNFPDFELAP